MKSGASKERTPYSKEVSLAVRDLGLTKGAGWALMSKSRLKALQELIDEQGELPPLPQEEPEEEPAPLGRDRRRGGGNWKSQPKDTLTPKEQKALQERIQKSGLHRTADQMKVSHATITKAARGSPIVLEKIALIRVGLKKAAPKRPTQKRVGKRVLTEGALPSGEGCALYAR